jgi:Domain of unknown function (DUF4403)
MDCWIPSTKPKEPAWQAGPAKNNLSSPGKHSLMKYFPAWLTQMTYFPAWLLLALIGSLGSCSPSKKLSAPAVVLSVPDSLPALPLSEIDLPLKIAGRPLLASADSLVPKEFLSDRWPGYLQSSCDFRYKYRFVRSGFTVHCANNKLSVQMQGNYQVAGSRCFCALNKPVSPWISGNCGFDTEPMRRVDISFSTQLTFLPNYRLLTLSRADQLKALDKCTMSVFGMDMTQQILDSIRSSITGFCTALDQKVSGLNFSGALQQTTAKAWQRTAMGPYGYLTINPSDIRIGTLDYTRDTFHLSMGVSCRPELGSDSINRFAKTPPLPPLRSGANRGGVVLYLSVRYDYSFLNKTLNDTLRNRSFLFKGNTVIIKDVALKGIGHHQVEIKIDFDGSRKGRIYLRGTPVLDTARQTLSVPDISYSLESKDMALKMARAILHNKIRRSLRGNSYLDLAALLKTNLPVLDTQLNRQMAPNLYSSGHVRQLKLIGLLAGDKTIQAQVFVNADLSVTGTGLPK